MCSKKENFNDESGLDVQSNDMLYALLTQGLLYKAEDYAAKVICREIMAMLRALKGINLEEKLLFMLLGCRLTYEYSG